MLSSGMNLITTVIGFGMSVTFIIFVCTRLICGRIRAIESRASAPTAFESEFRSEPEHIINGLEPVIIAAFPTVKFNRDAFRSREDAQCSICLGEYQDKEILRIMPVCGHNFHVSCIDTWLQQQSTCPVCRLPLRDSVEAKHMISSMFSAILESRDSAEDESERSYQWLLPNQVHSSDAESNQEHRVSVPRNLEPTHAQETETNYNAENASRFLGVKNPSGGSVIWLKSNAELRDCYLQSFAIEAYFKIDHEAFWKFRCGLDFLRQIDMQLAFF